MILSDKFGKEYIESDALFVRCQGSTWKYYYDGLYSKVFKRFLDVFLSLLMIAPAIVLMIPFALLIALNGTSPLCFQNRVGKGGRIFRMIKLRSMCVNAENRVQSDLASNPDKKQEWEASQKLQRNPRISLVSNFIRRTSIDELPQLFNVLMGHMSLVGPRPIMEDQLPLYRTDEYFLIRPGITGEWQLSGSDIVDLSERAHSDKAYYSKMSFWYDSKLLTRTIKFVFRTRGF